MELKSGGREGGEGEKLGKKKKKKVEGDEVGRRKMEGEIDR